MFQEVLQVLFGSLQVLPVLLRVGQELHRVCVLPREAASPSGSVQLFRLARKQEVFTFFIKSAWLLISSACLSFSWEKRCSAAWALAADGNHRIRLNSFHPLGGGFLHSLSASFKPI